jgi:hypothetical protein
MKFLIAILILFSSTNAMTQLKKPTILFPSKEDTVSKSKSIKLLRQKANLIFAYRTYTTWDYAEPYTIIALMKDSSLASYKFSLPNKLVRLNTNSDSLKSKLDLVYTYDLFSMTKTGDWEKTCNNNSPGCGDCEEYDFVIMTKEKVKRLYFYVPAMYVDYCESVKQNKRIVDFIKRLWK